VIEYDHHGWDSERDGWLVKHEFGERLKRLISEAMRAVNHRWSYEIVVLEVKNHRPAPFKWDNEE